MSVLYYFLMIVMLLGLCVIVGYGLLILGGLLNGEVRKGRNWPLIYCIAIPGLALLFSEYIIDVNKDWSRALGGMLLVLALVTLINYKGRKRR